MKNILKIKKGFTLAEVLITLAIIGVVSAVTIPNLLTSSQGKEYAVAAQKALSTISNAMVMKEATDGRTLEEFMEDNGHDYGTVSMDDLTGMALYRYLASPDDGSGEDATPVLPVTVADRYSIKVKDGMWLLDVCRSGTVYYLIMDTNGEKGPTRTNQGNDWSSCSAGGVARSSDFMQPAVGYNIRAIQNQTIVETEESISADDRNLHPDIVTLAINTETNEVKPAGQRTLNIMATGNATISK